MIIGGRGSKEGGGRGLRGAACQDWAPGQEEEGVVHLAGAGVSRVEEDHSISNLTVCLYMFNRILQLTRIVIKNKQ